MGPWWTPARDEVAKHLAKKIREAQVAKDKAAETAAWRDYSALHGVKFVVRRFNVALEMVAEPMMLFEEADADAYLRTSGRDDPAAVTATVCACERLDEVRRQWTWSATANAWQAERQA